MRPNTATAGVANGAGSATITLTPGEVASAGLTSHRMTQRRDRRRGHRPADPANSQVYSFEAHIAVGPTNYTASGSVSSAGIYGCGSAARRRCARSVAAVLRDARPCFQGGVPLLQWLVIPARIGFLKEFFDISMVVQNLAGSEFTLKNGTAVARPARRPRRSRRRARRRPRASRCPDIARRRRTRPPTGSSAATARAPTSRAPATPATLDPIACRSSLEARLADPIQVYGASAMQVVVDTDDHYDDRYPATCASASATRRRRRSPTPRCRSRSRARRAGSPSRKQTREWTVASIGPGATWFPDAAGTRDDDFIIVPEPTGNVNLAESFITQAAGDSDDRISLSTHPQVQPAAQAPTLTARRRGEWIVLKWGAGAGATGYEAYGAPDRKTEFGATPLPMLDAQNPGQPADRHRRRSCAARTRRRSRLRTVTPGRLVLRHPTAEVIDGSGSHPTIEITNPEEACQRQRRTCKVHAYDPDFNFASITVSGPGVNVTRAGDRQRRRRDHLRRLVPAELDRRRSSRSRGHLAVGGEAPTDEITLGRSGDSNCDGEIHAAVMGDSYISGEGAYAYMAEHRRPRRHRQPLPPLAELVGGEARDVARRDALRPGVPVRIPTATGWRSWPARLGDRRTSRPSRTAATATRSCRSSARRCGRAWTWCSCRSAATTPASARDPGLHRARTAPRDSMLRPGPERGDDLVALAHARQAAGGGLGGRLGGGRWCATRRRAPRSTRSTT